MSKTCRAGKKNQLRRLAAHYYQTASTEFSAFIGTDYYYDKKYEELYNQSTRRDNNNSTTIIEWLSTLTPVTIEYPSLPPLTIKENDPNAPDTSSCAQKSYTSITKELLQSIERR